MREAFGTLFLIAFSLALGVILSNAFHSSASPDVAEQPKQLPFVIVVNVCKRVEYIVVTTTPPRGISRGRVASDATRALLKSTPKERVIILPHSASWCPSRT